MRKTGLGDDERWTLLRRCRDDSLALRLRVAGALVLLYGQNPTRIVELTSTVSPPPRPTLTWSFGTSRSFSRRRMPRRPSRSPPAAPTSSRRPQGREPRHGCSWCATRLPLVCGPSINRAEQEGRYLRPPVAGGRAQRARGRPKRMCSYPDTDVRAGSTGCARRCTRRYLLCGFVCDRSSDWVQSELPS